MKGLTRKCTSITAITAPPAVLRDTETRPQTRPSAWHNKVFSRRAASIQTALSTGTPPAALRKSATGSVQANRQYSRIGSDLLARLVGAGVRVASFARKQAGLEEVFLKVGARELS